MKFINTKSMKKYLIVMLAIVVASCADETQKPIVTFDDAGHGAYPRLVESTGELLANMQSQADFDASEYSYSVKFVDDNNGGNIATYTVNIEYIDVTGAASAGPMEFKSYTAADFTADGDGNMVLTNIGFTANDAASAFGLTYSTINVGDKFEFTGVLVQNSGAIHTGGTSSSTINGTAFQGYFDYTLPAACPSSIQGTYSFTSDTWCGNSVSGTVDIIAEGGGKYGFSDWSFGGYLDCYGGGVAVGDFNFVDVCQFVTLNDGDDSFGDSWSFTSVINGNDWEITWLNFTYAAGLENGVATVTFPDGIPFALAP